MINNIRFKIIVRKIGADVKPCSINQSRRKN